MIEIKEYKKLKDIENEWNEIFQSNDTLVPNVGYKFINVYTSGIYNKLQKLVQKRKTIFYLVKDNNENKLILPAELKNGKLVSLYTIDYFDVVSKKLSADDLYKYLHFIAVQKNMDIEILNLCDKSYTYNALKDKINFEVCEPCVEININEKYEDYYNTLTKHARQNLRTAYNRLETDGLKYRFEINYGKTSNKYAKRLNKIYINRRATRYSNMSFFKKIMLKINDPIASTCFGLENSFSACLYLNEKPVAFMGGVSFDKSIIIPRLAIDNNYSRYSAGVILINETIKDLLSKGYNCLDLATGDEPYKFQMGGTGHSSYKTTIHND